MTQTDKAFGGTFFFEPTLQVRKLPRCECGCPHPLAHQPPILNGKCPGCGSVAQSVGSFEVPAVWTGDLRLRIGSLFLGLGKALLALRRRLNGED